MFVCFCRQYSLEYKLETYLKIARLYLEDDDPIQAESFINRASLLQAESKNEQLQVYYKVPPNSSSLSLSLLDQEPLVVLPSFTYFYWVQPSFA